MLDSHHAMGDMPIHTRCYCHWQTCDHEGGLEHVGQMDPHSDEASGGAIGGAHDTCSWS